VAQLEVPYRSLIGGTEKIHKSYSHNSRAGGEIWAPDCRIPTCDVQFFYSKVTTNTKIVRKANLLWQWNKQVTLRYELYALLLCISNRLMATVFIIRVYDVIFTFRVLMCKTEVCEHSIRLKRAYNRPLRAGIQNLQLNLVWGKDTALKMFSTFFYTLHVFLRIKMVLHATRVPSAQTFFSPKQLQEAKLHTVNLLNRIFTADQNCPCPWVCHKNLRWGVKVISIQGFGPIYSKVVSLRC
jgi:hypothetical protein